MNEPIMQAVVMRWVMEERRHQIAVPNITTVYAWEADVLSVTRSLLTHEFEIKVSRSDYLKDKRKLRKHHYLASPDLRTSSYRGVQRAYTPNYFWYTTWGFDIDDLPPYAGWLVVTRDERWGTYSLTVKREAPRLHLMKMGDKTRLKMSRWLSFKLKNLYEVAYLRQAAAKGEVQ